MKANNNTNNNITQLLINEYALQQERSGTQSKGNLRKTKYTCYGNILLQLKEHSTLLSELRNNISTIYRSSVDLDNKIL